METVAETATRLGVPHERLERLIELPSLCRALVMAREEPELAPEQVFATCELPVCDPDGLDFDRMEQEVAKRRELATNSEGRVIEQRLGHPLITGRMERAEKIALRRLSVIEQAREDLLSGNYELAKAKLLAELERTGGEGRTG